MLLYYKVMRIRYIGKKMWRRESIDGIIVDMTSPIHVTLCLALQ